MTRCRAIHGAFHDNGEPVCCTLTVFHDGAHEDHSQLENTGGIVSWDEDAGYRYIIKWQRAARDFAERARQHAAWYSWTGDERDKEHAIFFQEEAEGFAETARALYLAYMSA